MALPQPLAGIPSSTHPLTAKQKSTWRLPLLLLLRCRRCLPRVAGRRLLRRPRAAGGMQRRCTRVWPWRVVLLWHACIIRGKIQQAESELGLGEGQGVEERSTQSSSHTACIHGWLVLSLDTARVIAGPLQLGHNHHNSYQEE